MSYQALIDTNLRKVFDLVKDLAVEVTLSKKTESFNFGTGLPVTSQSSTVVTKAIVIDSSKRSQDRNSTSKQIMFKSKDVGDLKSYSQVTIENVDWILGNIQKNDGFILLAEISREV